MPLYKDDSGPLTDMGNPTHKAQQNPPSLYLTYDLGNTLSRMSIPQWRYRASLRFSVENVAHLRTKFFAVISDQNVGSQTNRYRPLGVSAQCNTRHFQISGLFLNSTGIGDNHRGTPLKSQEFNIGHRLQQMKSRNIQIKGCNGLAGAWVNRKNNS